MSSFERGPLAYPNPEEERRSDLLAARATAEKQRDSCLKMFAGEVELLAQLDIDMENDYDRRMSIETYAVVRDALLARRMRYEKALEDAEEFLYMIKCNLGEDNKHDA